MIRGSKKCKIYQIKLAIYIGKMKNWANPGESFSLNNKILIDICRNDDSFEAALREQFESMKEAFEKKISDLQTNVLNLKKDKAYELVDLKSQLSRERDNKELLLRKLQIYSRT